MSMCTLLESSSTCMETSMNKIHTSSPSSGNVMISCITGAIWDTTTGQWQQRQLLKSLYEQPNANSTEVVNP